MQKLVSFFSIYGRSDRKVFTLLWILLYTTLCLFLVLSQPFSEYQSWYFFTYILFVLSLWPLSIRRLHDIGVGGCYAVVLIGSALLGSVSFTSFFMENQLFATGLEFVSWISLVMVAYLAIKKGNHGPNCYGEDPRWQETPRVQLDEFLSWCKVKSTKK